MTRLNLASNGFEVRPDGYRGRWFPVTQYREACDYAVGLVTDGGFDRVLLYHVITDRLGRKVVNQLVADIQRPLHEVARRREV